MHHRRRRPWCRREAWVAATIAWLGPAPVLAVVDVVAELYQLWQSGVAADRIAVKTMPSALARRLAEKTLRWGDLSGLLQRALLWDLGLVMSGSGALVQVHVPCGKTISQIFLTKDVFRAADCPIVACNEKNLHFASPSCSAAAVGRVSQCAVESEVMAYSQSTLWSEDGDIETVPDIRVYQYEDSSNVSNTSSDATVIYTISQDQTILRARRDCPAKPFFTVPCTVRSMDNAGDWCAPSRGAFVDVWIDKELAKLDGSPGSSLSTAAMALIVFVFTLLAGCVLAWQYYVRRRRELARGAGSTMLYSTAEFPTLSGKSDDNNFAPIVPLPSRTHSYTGDHTSGRGDMDGDGTDGEASSESLCRYDDDLMSIQQDRELMKKRIPYTSLLFVTLIARGANGEVWRAEYKNQIVAIKNLLPEKRHDRAAIEVFGKEIRLASCLEHPNIVRFIGVAWHRLSDICIVSEFMPRGDLSDLIYSKDSGSLRWTEDKMCIAIDIASALAYLHALVPLIIHRDLKSHNVLLNDRLQAKLSDFGLSRERSFEETMTNGIGTLLWTAPEILRGEAYTEKADVFSYGIVLTELDTCLPPYSLNDEVKKQQLNSMQLMHLVTMGEISPRFRADCPAALQALARRCVAVSPAERPSAAQIVFTLRAQVLPSVLAAA